MSLFATVVSTPAAVAVTVVAALSTTQVVVSAQQSGNLTILECNGTFCKPEDECKPMAPPVNTCMPLGEGFIKFTCESETQNSCGQLSTFLSDANHPPPKCGKPVGLAAEVCNQCKPYKRKTDGQIRYTKTMCDATKPQANPTVKYDCTDDQCSEGCASHDATIPRDGSCFSSNETKPLDFQWTKTFACPAVCQFAAFSDSDCTKVVYSSDVPSGGDSCTADITRGKSYKYKFTSFSQ